MAFKDAIEDMVTGLEGLGYTKAENLFTLLRTGSNVFDKSFTFGIGIDGSVVVSGYTVDHSLGSSTIQFLVGYEVQDQDYMESWFRAWDDWEQVLKPFIIKDFTPTICNDKFLYNGATLQPSIGDGNHEYLILTIPLQYVGEQDL